MVQMGRVGPSCRFERNNCNTDIFILYLYVWKPARCRLLSAMQGHTGRSEDLTEKLGTESVNCLLLDRQSLGWLI